MSDLDDAMEQVGGMINDINDAIRNLSTGIEILVQEMKILKERVDLHDSWIGEE